jgi:S1-C subfamily serine protease
MKFVLVKLILLISLGGLPCLAQTLAAADASRFAVPILCTETHLAGRTRAHGSGVVVDTSGVIITAAHVVTDAHSFCSLTVVVPSGEWSRTSGFHPFKIGQCETNLPLDIAVCRINPVESKSDYKYLRAAPVGLFTPAANSRVTIMGFTGWGFYPTVLPARVQSAQLMRRQDGCYCDFAVDTSTYQGMSGSPLVSANGEVVGIITTSGTGKFRGLSFGTDFERAATFLKRNGLGNANASRKE